MTTNKISKKINRGKALSIFLFLQIAVSVLGIFAILALMGELISVAQLSPETSVFETQLLVYSSIAVLIFVIICVFGVWHWRIWGYWGVIAAYIVSIIIAVFTWQPQQIIVNAVWLILFYFLTRNKTKQFLWKF